MDNDPPNNSQIPSWFADASSPILVTPPPATKPHKQKRLLLIISVLVAAMLIAGGIVAYLISVQSARQSAVRDFRDAYVSFYTTFSSLDDIQEPEGIDPSDISSQWQAYNNTIGSLKKSSVYSDYKDIIDAIESTSATYNLYVTNTVPELVQYMADCTYNSEAGTPNITDGCLTHLQNITKSSDSTAQPIAESLLNLLSNAKLNGIITEADIAHAQDLELKLFSIPNNFASIVYPKTIQLGSAVGLNFADE